MAQVLSLDAISLRHSGNPAPVVRELSFTLEAGEFVTLVGSSGVGKSTILRAVDGLIPSEHGRITLAGGSAATERERAFVFQDARLLPWRRVLGNVTYGLETLKLSKAERLERAHDALQLVGLAGLADRFPHQLSGGQKQRVGIARALAVKPDLLLMDEPFSSVDAITRRELQRELVQVWQRSGCAVLFVTHDMEEAVFLSDRVLLLAGAPASVFREYRVSIERPRQRDDPELFRLAAHITGDLEGTSSGQAL